jgi:hypothetical protein
MSELASESSKQRSREAPTERSEGGDERAARQSPGTNTTG